MATITETTPSVPIASAAWPLGWTMADLRAELGDIQAERIIAKPFPGTATESDLIKLDEQKRYCELIDCVLVEKPVVGAIESGLAFELIYLLGAFLRQHDLGIGTGPDGPYRLLPGNVRYPDVAFIAWSSFAGRQAAREAISPVVPDLAIEILSRATPNRKWTANCTITLRRA